MMDASARPGSSFSAAGRSCDAAPTGGPVLHRESLAKTRQRLKLRPWDGVELVEATLAEASHRVRADRELPVSSSPRVNPALAARDVVEGTEALTCGFLTSLGAQFPSVGEAAPAVVAARAASTQPAASPSPTRQREPAADGSFANDATLGDSAASPSTKRKRGAASPSLLALRSQLSAPSVHRAQQRSACFGGPPRDKPEPRRAPAVGHYNPKAAFTQRRAQSAAMARAPRPGFETEEDLAKRRRHLARGKQGASGSPAAALHASMSSASPSSLRAASFEHVQTTATVSSGAQHHHAASATKRSPERAAKPASDAGSGGAEEAEAKRKAARLAAAAAGTSAFKSRTQRFMRPASGEPRDPPEPESEAARRAKLAPWPLPSPGSRPSTAGRISTLPRKGAFEGEGLPATISYVDTTKMRPQTPCTVNMRRATSRESHRGAKQLYGGEPAPARDLELEKVDATTVLSTAPRAPSPAAFDKMRSRPPSAPPTVDHAPLPERKLDPPRGFVDISRMVYEGERVLTADPAAVAQRSAETPLNPNYDLVLRRAPSPIVGTSKGQSAFANPAMRARSATPGPRVVSPARAASPAAAAAGVRPASSMSISAPPPPPRPHTSTGASRHGAAAIEMSTIDDAAFYPALDHVKRRAPSPSLQGTTRDAPIMRQSRDVAPETVYDARPVPAHVPGPSLALGLSRVRRDLRFKQPKPMDTVYEPKAPRIVGGALAFAKYKARP